MKLKRLRINKYRIIKPGTELFFNDGVNLLIGKNGTGKTTLLNLLSMIFGGDFSRLAEEDFDLEYEFLGTSGILELSVSNQADVKPGGERDMGERQAVFRYALKLVFRSPTLEGAEEFHLDASNASTTVRYGDGYEEHWDILVTPFRVGGNFMNFVFKRQRNQALRAAHSARVDRFPRRLERFDECTEWLKKAQESGSVELYHYFDENAYSTSYSAGSSMLSPDEVGRRIIEHTPDQQINSVSLSSSDLAFLDRTVRALGYQEASMVADLKKSSYIGADDYYGNGVPVHTSLFQYGNFRFFFVKHDGSRIPFDHLSFGEKRLLGYHYYLDTHEHVLLADELANGMHHDMIDRCLDVLEGRQAFLATQNPLLLDHIGFSSVGEVRSSFVLCRCETDHKRQHMVLSHMTEEQSADFFADYQVGIQHVNEVLRMRGLW